MIKELSLDDTWKYCLQMWKWIAKQIEKNPFAHVSTLKQDWLEKHPQFKDVYNNCFFCEYMKRLKGDKEGEGCKQCPGRLVDKTFYCLAIEQHFLGKPITFCQNLLELNKERKKK